MKYVKKKATLQNVNLSASGAAMLADSSEQLVPLSGPGHNIVNADRGLMGRHELSHTALAAIQSIKSNHHAQNMARLGTNPQQSQGYSKAQLIADRERRDRLREMRGDLD